MVPFIERHGTTTWALMIDFWAVESQHPSEAKTTIVIYVAAYLWSARKCHIWLELFDDKLQYS